MKGIPIYYNVLKKRGLNKAGSRLEWVRKLSGEVVTTDASTDFVENHRHIL